MKKRLLQILFILCFPFLIHAKSVMIKGFLTNSGSFKYAYLYEFYGNDLIKKDSAAIKNNEFIFKSSSAYPRGFYQIKFDEKTFINLILSDENITIKSDLNNINSDTKILGSKENDVYNTYKTFAEVHSEYMRNIQNDANKISALQNTDPQEFNLKITALKAKFDSLNTLQQDYYKELARKNEKLFISKFLNNLVVDSSKTKENFISGKEFSDPELLRGDILTTKINIFFQMFVEQSLPSWQQESKNIIKKTAGTKGQEIAFIALLNLFNSVDMDLTSEIATEYIKAYPNSAKAKAIMAQLPKPAPKVGDMAPDILLPDANGKNVPLSSLRGKVVLIDFWASWCGPCRMENPNVVKVFNKYKDKGFTIYGVSLDGDKNKWLQAIDKDNLTWTHVSDLKNWKSAGAELYGVRSIPATFLVDKNGKIIAKNLRGEQLESELRKILEKN